jgi:hypothetical protein
MPISDTAKEYNARASLKKFFIDNLGSTVFFDKSLGSPDLRNPSTKKWVLINFKDFTRASLGEFYIEAYCATRQDPEGMELSKLVDELMGLLYDPTKSDGVTHIPFYKADVTPWIHISAMVMQEVIDTPPFRIPEDETKVKIMSIRFRWGMEI